MLFIEGGVGFTCGPGHLARGIIHYIRQLTDAQSAKRLAVIGVYGDSNKTPTWLWAPRL